MISDQKPPIEIKSERLTLRKKSADQAAQTFALIQHNRLHLSPWMNWALSTTSVQDAADYIELTQKWWDQGFTFDFAMVLNDQQKIIGSAGLHSINWTSQSCALGYWIDQGHQGQGFVVEACQKLVEVAAQMKFHRLVITCESDNERSIKVAKALGFTYESRATDHRKKTDGTYSDTLTFVKLINESIKESITEGLPHGYAIQFCDSDKFWNLVEEKQKVVFEDDYIVSPAGFLSEGEKAKLKELSYQRPWAYHAVILFKGEAVGWSWGYQDNLESCYMVNSAVMPDHRGRGLYSALLKNVIQVLKEKGFQKIWSRHTMTNNAIIIPKLKMGFQITGTELSDVFGTLVHLSLYTNPKRKKVLETRAGQFRPDSILPKTN